MRIGGEFEPKSKQCDFGLSYRTTHDDDDEEDDDVDIGDKNGGRGHFSVVLIRAGH